MLYYDELETCNPLESKAKIHKLGKDKLVCLVFNYAYLGAFIFHWVTCHQSCDPLWPPSSYIAAHEVDAILRPFAGEIKKLVRKLL